MVTSSKKNDSALSEDLAMSNYDPRSFSSIKYHSFSLGKTRSNTSTARMLGMVKRDARITELGERRITSVVYIKSTRNAH